LTTYLTFRLDALVLLSANEAKEWRTSIYSYVKACWRASLLIDPCRACALSVQSMMWLGGCGHSRVKNW